MLPPVPLLLLACAGVDDAEAPDTDTPSTETDTDEQTFDTGIALVYFEGSAELSADAWTGEEDYVATSRNGADEYCRVANVVSGTPSAEICEGCTFAFDVTLGTGEMTGDACENMRFTADMLEGDGWTYAFAETWPGASSGYDYRDVLLYGYDAGDSFEWFPAAYAEVDGEVTRIDYEKIHAYTAYYYYL